MWPPKESVQRLGRGLLSALRLPDAPLSLDGLRIGESPLRWILPLVCPIAVLVLGAVLRQAIGIDQTGHASNLENLELARPVYEPAGHALSDVAVSLAPPEVWGASVLVLVVSMIVIAILAVLIIRRACGERKFLGRTAVALSFVFLAIPLLCGHRRPEGTLSRLLTGPPVQGQIYGYVGARTGHDVFTVAWRLGAWSFEITLLASVAIAAMMVRPAGPAPPEALAGAERNQWRVKALASQLLRYRALLSLGTILLALGVVSARLFFPWAEAIVAATPDVTKDAAQELTASLQTVGTSSAIVLGTFFTLCLAAIFGPAEIVLHAEALALAVDVQPDKPETWGKWMQDAGLAPTLVGRLARIGAVFAPLLSGLVSNFIHVG